MSVKKLHITGGSIIPQPDWNQTDESQHDYIKNKPENLADFKEDSTHRFVTDTEKSTWSSASNKVDTLVGSDASKSARTIASEEVAKIVAGADASYDTLKEIADWISSHKTDATAMNSAIVKLEAIVKGIGGSGEKATVVAYVNDAIAALKIGDYAKASDLTTLAARVKAIEDKNISTGANKVEKSTTNGNIKIDGTETVVYTHPGSGKNPHGTTASDVGAVSKAGDTMTGPLTVGGATIAKGASADIIGTTKQATTVSNQLVLQQGAVFSGTAANAGLVTRGICGVSTPDNSGACTKENLYINYDSSNDYQSNRQLILQAGNAGEHYGNNLYQYAAARGDAVKRWAESNLVTVNSDQTISGLKTFNAPTNTVGKEQTTIKFKTPNGGAIIFGKEGSNSGTMIRLDQNDGTARLRFRSSGTPGAMVWEQPEQGAQLYIDLGKDGADKRRIQFPSSAGTLALDNHTHTAGQVGAVPTSRKVNGKALSSDITLSANDVGAAPSSHASDSAVHITDDERNTWNAKQEHYGDHQRIYIKSGAADGGDGSAEKPLKSVDSFFELLNQTKTDIRAYIAEAGVYSVSKPVVNGCTVHITATVPGVTLKFEKTNEPFVTYNCHFNLAGSSEENMLMLDFGNKTQLPPYGYCYFENSSITLTNVKTLGRIVTYGGAIFATNTNVGSYKFVGTNGYLQNTYISNHEDATEGILLDDGSNIRVYGSLKFSPLSETARSSSSIAVNVVGSRIAFTNASTAEEFEDAEIDAGENGKYYYGLVGSGSVILVGDTNYKALESYGVNGNYNYNRTFVDCLVPMSRGKIAANSDLNEIVVPGTYYVGSDVASTIINSPIATTAFTLDVSATSGRVTQTVCSYSTSVSKSYMRSSNAGIFTEWLRLDDTDVVRAQGAISSNTDLNDVKKAGSYYASGSVAKTLINSPVTTTAFTMTVDIVSNRVTQTICTYSTGDRRAYIRSSNAGLFNAWMRIDNVTEDAELLWENPDDTVEFPSQTVTLDLTGYRSVIVLSKFRMDNNSLHVYSKSFIDGVPIQSQALGGNGSYATCGARIFTVNSTGIYFGTGAKNGAVDNSYHIPIKIYGVK